MYQLNNENREANVVVMIMNKLDIKKVKKGKKALSSETGEFKKKKEWSLVRCQGKMNAQRHDR